MGKAAKIKIKKVFEIDITKENLDISLGELKHQMEITPLAQLVGKIVVFITEVS